MLHVLRLGATTATTATAAAARAASCHGAAMRRLHASAPRAFLFRSLDDVARDGHVVSTPQSDSSRLFVRGDGLGFSVQHEVFRRGSAPVRLEFRNHVVAVVVTKGRGRLQLLDAHGAAVERHEHALEAGSSFALSAAEPAALTIESDELHVVSVMNPPLVGPEQKNEETGVFPVIDQDGVARESFDHAAIRRLCEPPESLKGGSSPMKDDPLF